MQCTWSGDVYWCIDGFMGTGKYGIMGEAAGITPIGCTLPPRTRTMEETYSTIALGCICIGDCHASMVVCMCVCVSK